jgi:hypothetical protein
MAGLAVAAASITTLRVHANSEVSGIGVVATDVREGVLINSSLVSTQGGSARPVANGRAFSSVHRISTTVLT